MHAYDYVKKHVQMWFAIGGIELYSYYNCMAARSVTQTIKCHLVKISTCMLAIDSVENRLCTTQQLKCLFKNNFNWCLNHDNK